MTTESEGIEAFAMLSAIYPAPVVAMAMCRIARELQAAGKTAEGQGLLYKLWRPTQKFLASNLALIEPKTTTAVSAVFLEQYFAHQGDWLKIEASLRKHILLRWPDRSADLEELLEAVAGRHP